MRPDRLGVASGLLLIMSIGPDPVAAQPAATFSAACHELRQSIRDADIDPDRNTVIEVIGPVADVDFDGALAYIVACAPPDPLVLCVTYTTGDWQPGDIVGISGTYRQIDPDHIVLDPCLHAPPDR